MKDRNTTPVIIILSIVALLAGGYFLLRLYTPKYVWSENLNYNNEEPYGTSILFELIKNSYPEENFIEITSNDFEKYFGENPNSDYVFIGSSYFIDSLNLNSLIQHIEKGNKAFIGVTYNFNSFIETWLNDSVNSPEIYPAYNDSILAYNRLQNLNRSFIKSFKSDTIATKLRAVNYGADSIFTFHHQYVKDTMEYSWSYFSSHFFAVTKDYSPEILSTIDQDKANFVSLKVGEGTLYLHSTPILLSNYHLIEKETFNYLQSIWKNMDSEKILWDNNSYFYNHRASNPQLRESPLRFILKHKSLRWAWYMLLVLVFLFIIIQSKRKQNIIPLVRIKKNNTLDYAKAIGALYFQTKSHRIIADEMIGQLYSFIKSRYNIKIDKNKNELIPRLSKISGVKKETLSELFKLEIEVKFNKDATSEQLSKLYYIVDYFYKNCN